MNSKEIFYYLEIICKKINMLCEFYDEESIDSNEESIDIDIKCYTLAFEGIINRIERCRKCTEIILAFYKINTLVTQQKLSFNPSGNNINIIYSVLCAYLNNKIIHPDSIDSFKKQIELIKKMIEDQ